VSYTLRDAFPQPQPILLAGRLRFALPLRLKDLATFEALAAAGAGDPFAGCEAEDAATRRAALRRAWDAAEAGFCAWGSQAVHATLYGTEEGLATLVAVVLRPESLTRDGAAELARVLTAEEWHRLDAVAFGSDPLAEAQRRIYAELGITEAIGGPGEGVPWPVAVAELCAMLHITPDQAGELTLPQVRLLRSGGKSEPPRPEKPREWTSERYRRDVLWGLEKFWREGRDGQ
jgi:hypothetical protein